jgi:uncharacterized protein (TIGR02996 family)
VPDEEIAFLTAIELDPTDESLRLAFADWLEARGDPRGPELRARCQQIGRIKDNLPLLAAKDRFHTYFAAQHHRYQMLPPLPEAIIRALEAEYGVRFPNDYVDFLARIAEGGAGPSYGLYPLRICCHARMTERFPFEEAPGSSYDPWTDPVTREALSDPVTDTGHYVPGLNTKSCTGCIALCDHGCCSASYLVITGKERGKVWDYHGGGDGMWHPTGTTFLPWYTAWLDTGLGQLRAAEPRIPLPKGATAVGEQKETDGV